MVSQINPSLPVTGLPTTPSVRRNFEIAHDEISALQAAGPFLPISGGTIAGALSITGRITCVPPPAAPVRINYGMWNAGQFLLLGDPSVAGDAGAIMSLAIDQGDKTCWCSDILGVEGDVPSFALISYASGAAVPYAGLWNDGAGLQIGTTDDWGRPDRAGLSITATGASFALPVILAADPAEALEAATKRYVDDAIDALRAELTPDEGADGRQR